MRKGGWRVFVGALVVLTPRIMMATGGFTVDRVTADINLPTDAVTRLRHGEMVHSDTEESSDRELGVGLTFLVQQPLAEVVKAFRTAIDLKADPQLSASAVIRGPGAPADFTSLVLEPDGAAEASRYLAASPGETLNLSRDEIRAFNALASAGDDVKRRVEEELRLLLLARYQSYLQRGLGGMAAYERRDGPFEPSGELRRASEAALLLEQHAPALQHVLLAYPVGKPPGLEEHFYWLRYDLDGRPNYTLRHRLAMPIGEIFVTADREFYVSHGYNTSQAFAGLIPVPEGTMVVYRSRVSTDQVAGFGSSVKKGIGRSVMSRQLTDIFERSRDSFQRNH
ncbi:MAG TPA: hypothetical protein VMS22_11220 [Candidatus Eisenbacteria bacterium]|nr:hypothetical protein [Candidatus Eisenbacteria bacterium]